MQRLPAGSVMSRLNPHFAPCLRSGNRSALTLNCKCWVHEVKTGWLLLRLPTLIHTTSRLGRRRWGRRRQEYRVECSSCVVQISEVWVWYSSFVPSHSTAASCLESAGSTGIAAISPDHARRYDSVLSAVLSPLWALLGWRIGLRALPAGTCPLT